MIETLPPHRAELARHILEAVRLAREQDDAMTEYLLDMALREVLPRDDRAHEVLSRLHGPSD